MTFTGITAGSSGYIQKIYACLFKTPASPDCIFNRGTSHGIIASAQPESKEGFVADHLTDTLDQFHVDPGPSFQCISVIRIGSLVDQRREELVKEVGMG